MTFESPDFLLAAPEMFVLGMACFILVVDLFLTERSRIVTYLLTQLTLLGAVLLTLHFRTGAPRLAFDGAFINDAMGEALKIVIYIVSAAVFLYSRGYLRERGLLKGEYYVLGLFGVLGMMIMVSAHSFLTLYLGLELLSLSLYALVALARDSRAASEAAMKYFVLGALASGMLLYGMSMLYGVTGSLDIAQVGHYVIDHYREQNVVLSFGLVFVIVGLAFKLGAVPFHMWIPDVYEGAPTSVTLYISAAPKVAAFALFMRLLVEGLGGLHGDWRDMLVILSVLSMAVGNIVAIAQSNLKRMLAYSTISHAGFLLLGILAGTPDGYASAMFYTIAYALMALGGFGMIILLSRAGFEADTLDDFKGLNERSPWFAFMMLILMFSMAGVPPTIGFYAKLSVLQAVIKVDMVWLAVAAVVFSIIGAFYYLRVVKLMYFDKPVDSRPLQTQLDMRMTMSLNGLAVLGLGIFPGALMSLCMAALH
ncbi:MAG: NADH-quinone oxidoreductase subunit NuoN [Gammaproteobacteria bacterium]|nr:NADH-quinone oxidoreductase subunit NuoN [Gammaproteobacteria bacterium]